jgi:hypothetical protein
MIGYLCRPAVKRKSKFASCMTLSLQLLNLTTDERMKWIASLAYHF